MNYYVYTHLTSDTNQVFYVGKGQNRRAWNPRVRSDEWKDVYKKHGFEVNVIFRTEDQDLAFFVEKEAIDLYRKRGANLVNLSSGGEGCLGYKHKPEHIERMKGNNFGEKGWGAFRGHKHSEEQKRQWSEERKGKPSHRKGKTHSLEAKEKMRLARLGRPNIAQRKLTAEQVEVIKASYPQDTIVHLARVFGVGESTIHRIITGQLYRV